ncbi:helix-turn-helix domain-containing protein [Synechococcus elongatus]|uniref:helix-turn-helix domain-containing protein n=1 Tax=Synechococcus elongatus TaxID=32046 RepID=UPI000F7EEE80|nr:helix-turn-helix transcriptional regulator [Synechococcus elongatus]
MKESASVIRSKYFGDLIREVLEAYRIKSGMPRASIRDLSKVVGISAAMLYKYESGGVHNAGEISVNRWMALAKVLGCSVEDCLYYCETGRWPEESGDRAVLTPINDLAEFRQAIVDLVRRVEAEVPPPPRHPNAEVIERLETLESALQLPAGILARMLNGYGISEEELRSVYDGETPSQKLMAALETLEAPFLSMS